MFTFENIQDQEVVHQRCVLISGRCETSSESSDAFIKVETKTNGDNDSFPTQSWPMSHGWFKALVILSPGENALHITSSEDESHSTVITLQYIPLLQAPPLHLAILVAKDSPLLIDCPPRKFGALSGAHSSLNAAIAKFRLTAYMWQALTAEELRANGLGRRSFRLEEEWAADTLSQSMQRGTAMNSTAKVHLIRTDKTVAELRSAQFAQQNPKAAKPNELHDIFSQSLKAHGGPFTSEAKPVVAGLILDSTYDVKNDLILAHAALGAHNPNGLSLGIMGSHLTYAWPRFMEEVPDCLLDQAPPGDQVGNDNGECVSMWEACAVGQGAFLHEVGHAFSAPHTTGIMARGYSRDWPKCFLAKTAFCVHAETEGIEPVTPSTPNNCHWDIRDMLRFVNLPHFRHPHDTTLNSSYPNIEIQDDEDITSVVITSEAGIAQVSFNGQAETRSSVTNPQRSIRYTLDELENRFDLQATLEIEVLGMNGKHTTKDVVKLLSNRASIRVPGTGIRLQKKSAMSPETPNNSWSWAVMFKKRSRDGTLVSASKIDLRVGCVLDGVIVHYKDGSRVPCAPRGPNGKDLNMGGHQSKKIAIPKNVDVVKVAVTKDHDELRGLRIWLSNGKAMGALNKHDGADVEVLVPDANQRIIGFFGGSNEDGWQSIHEFGIVTAPKDQPIPDAVYHMPELQNNSDRGAARSHKRRKIEQADSYTEDEDTSEDEDTGYDNESDNGDLDD
ncbi:zinc metallo proteinase [Dactylonectria macrodidyma]|uniref:Zinc metallo proteinase n=1 Tax=Dactylonectria macrodidyma TaxID=307937 RepID=A0A9P9DVR9_9HYPO|nr:zinc metallo proteinase [Dactylonectria macrodidyma]